MLRVWMEKESSLGVLGLQKSKSTESCPPPTPTQPRPKIFRKWLKLHARVRAAVQLHAHSFRRYPDVAGFRRCDLLLPHSTLVKLPDIAGAGLPFAFWQQGSTSSSSLSLSPCQGSEMQWWSCYQHEQRTSARYFLTFGPTYRGIA